MKFKSFKQYFFYTIAIGLSIILLFIVVCFTWIGYEVKSQCQPAIREYNSDCVNSLIAVLNDEKKSFRTRNSAIWVLGQLGDRRALPVLQSYYTGTFPSREPLDQTISQYELKKAIKLAEGGFNITALFWRSKNL